MSGPTCTSTHEIATTRASECPGFWADMSPCEHFVHLYAGDRGLLDLLHGFTVDALRGGEAAVVIATPEHLAELDRRLTADGFDLTAARWQGQYLPMDAKATLAQFMISGWPDDEQFNHVMSNVLARARRNGRRVRAFGEMVALLWADGRADATVRLEHLWNEFCRSQSLPLFCAYPLAAFDEDAAGTLTDICKAHSRLIAA
ncbi:MAG TPA: MEDS domain-containing protein [Xanthomonadaceae bacterium]|nr:MEDS domain-containing protein [Xanthomonadaceae bacterium]